MGPGPEKQQPGSPPPAGARDGSLQRPGEASEQRFRWEGVGLQGFGTPHSAQRGPASARSGQADGSRARPARAQVLLSSRSI